MSKATPNKKPEKNGSAPALKVSYIRHVVQAFVLIIVVVTTIDFTFPALLIWRLDPLPGISASLAGNVIPVEFLVLATAMLGAAAVFGRAFCGWICPLGFIQDMASLGKKKNRMPGGFRYVKYALLTGGLALPVFAGWTFLEWFSPMPMIPRALLPIWGVWGGLMAGLFILFISIAFAVLVERRAWCRHVCPLGALLSLPSAVKLFGIRLDSEKCKKCMKCEKKCSMGIIDIKKQLGLTWDSECITCLSCRDVCPDGAIDLAYRY